MNFMTFAAATHVADKMRVKAWEDWFEREGLVGRYVFQIDFTDDCHGLVHCYKLRNGSRYLTDDRKPAFEPPFTMEFASPAPLTGIRMFRPGGLVASDEGR